MENRINQIVQLQNKDKYLILKQAVYRNQNYYLVSKVNETEDEIIEDPILLQEIKEGNQIRLEKITDADTFRLVASYFDLLEK